MDSNENFSWHSVISRFKCTKYQFLSNQCRVPLKCFTKLSRSFSQAELVLLSVPDRPDTNLGKYITALIQSRSKWLCYQRHLVDIKKVCTWIISLRYCQAQPQPLTRPDPNQTKSQSSIIIQKLSVSYSLDLKGKVIRHIQKTPPNSIFNEFLSFSPSN